jgi:ribonucleoside-diphosphate reductase alpha chain
LSNSRHAGLEGGFGPVDHAPFDAPFAHGIYKQKYSKNGTEEWHETAARVPHHVFKAIGHDTAALEARVTALMADRKAITGGRYLYAAGRDLHQVQNCALYRAEDTREGWADLVQKSTMSLMTGAGIGVWYGDVRPSGSIIARTGGIASGPLSLMKIVNELGRNVMQGGARRSAIWAGLPWWHADVFAFIRAKDWSQEIRDLKEKDFTFPADLDMTNISVTLDKSFFAAYHNEPLYEEVLYGRNSDAGTLAPDGRTWHEWAVEVYRLVVSKMTTTAEPGFSVDYDNPNENLRNACTEVTSEDDSDICNLGSLNMARFDDLEEFGQAVEDFTALLLAGTVYSHLPHDEVHVTREKNRRLGLGLMGVHEWLLKRGKRYAPDAELANWLDVYRDRSDKAARDYADAWGISRPLKVRAIAPNGTIGIIAETTTSAEPIFAAAIKRRVRNASTTKDTIEFEYVVDPTAARLVASGVPAESIEDAYTLSYDVERRVAFQAWLQQWVDHGISSTVNLPHVYTELEQIEFGDMLIEYLPKLRGITCYPDGSRGGQPLTSVPLEYALKQGVGIRFEENEDRCVGGLCGV